MKIVGNIKDYYDGAASQFGYSTDVVYNRLNSVTTHLHGLSVPYDGKELNKCSITIGFCGKIYYGFIGNRIYYPYLPKDVSDLTELIVAAKKTSRYYNSIDDKNLEEMSYSLGIDETKGWTRRDYYKGSLDIIENHKVFQDFGCPTFVILNYCSVGMFRNGPGKKHDLYEMILLGSISKMDSLLGTPHDRRTFLIKNPILKDFEFGKLVDPYTAVQEIEMYLGRLATNNTPPMPVGSDKVIAESKGFDKYSFRKLPTKKK